MGRGKRVAIYTRVSTDGQTTENQRLELEEVAARRGWEVYKIYTDRASAAQRGATSGRDSTSSARMPRAGVSTSSCLGNRSHRAERSRRLELHR